MGRGVVRSSRLHGNLEGRADLTGSRGQGTGGPEAEEELAGVSEPRTACVKGGKQTLFKLGATVTVRAQWGLGPPRWPSSGAWVWGASLSLALELAGGARGSGTHRLRQSPLPWGGNWFGGNSTCEIWLLTLQFFWGKYPRQHTSIDLKMLRLGLPSTLIRAVGAAGTDAPGVVSRRS